ncbi:MAG: hypothetical protein PHD76_00455 [Methylacidiphilales bacterium]|nr:hypothetical protein [Candidatus Methylacidiphilales bacterium]
MNRLSSELLDQALRLTATRLDQLAAPQEVLVVCGGSALLALGLVGRTTKDVDVLAGVDATAGLVDPRPLSPTLRAVVDEVGSQLDLTPGWLNAGPADQVLMGLPEGFLSRLIRRDYGAKLIIYYPDRFDLIHLKLFAVIDQGPGRHVSDLLKLTPSDNELLAAARWVLTQDSGETFPLLVKDALNQLGFSHVASQL